MLQSETFFMHHHPQSVMSKTPQNVSEWLWRLFTLFSFTHAMLCMCTQQL